MNLQCPNCQKLLTVQEHYAGQLMKCPLCKENFTVPALPPGPATEPAPAFTAPPTPGPDLYGLKSEPDPAFSALGAPTLPKSAPEPAFTTSPTPPSSLPSSGVTTEPARAPTPPPTLSAGYTKVYSLVISDRILRWAPPASLILIVLLLFFPWVGVYPGGITAVSQNAFQAVWGGYSDDLDMKSTFPMITEDEAKKDRGVSNVPGWNVLMLFYIFPLFPLALLVTVAVAALPFIKVPLPPQVQQVMPWRWAIVAGANAVLLLFLGLQLLLGFSLESNAKAWMETRPSVQVNAQNNEQKKKAEVRHGEMLEWLQRTIWLRMVVFLHLLATATAALVYWIEKRGPSLPLPRIDVSW